MKQIVYFFSKAALAVFFLAIAANQIFAQNPVFPVGEKLTYTISFANFADAGVIEVYAAGREKIGDREVNVIRANIRTAGEVQAILLDINHDAATFCAAETGLPVRVERTRRESGKVSETKHDFSENQALSTTNVYDVFSAIYQLRRTNPATAALPLKIWENDKIYELRPQLVARENVTTGVGAFNNAIVLQMRTADEVLDNYKAKIYFSDDERHLPLAVSLKLPQGELRAELASVEIIPPETAAVAAVVQPTPQTTTPPPVNPILPRPPQPRPTATPKPYVENEPLDAELPFGLGEKLEFEVLRNNQKIAVVNLEIKERKLFNSRDSVLLTAAAKSFNNSNIFSPNDKIQSYIDPNFLVPQRQEIRLSGVLAGFNQGLNFDQQAGAVTSDKAVRTDVPVGTHDALSFVYALRAFRYSTAQKNALDTRAAVFLGDAPVVVTLKPTQEKIDFNNVKVDTIALSMITGNPQIDSLNLRLWLSDDARRLPLKLTFNTPLGVVQANLVKF